MENQEKDARLQQIEAVDEKLSQEVLEKYSLEENTRKTGGWYAKVIAAVALAMACFHVYTSGTGILETMMQRSIHLFFVLILAFLMYPGAKKRKNAGPSALDIIFAVLSILAVGYVIVDNHNFLLRSGIANRTDVVMAILLTVLILEATRRCVAKELSIVAIIFLLYGYFGYLMPGIFRIRGGSITRLVDHLYMIPEGIFGTCLGTSANYIVLFVIFGAFLEKSGLGTLIQDIAIALTGRQAGGPAKVSVISSALFGSVSGSAAANVVTTGSFTIPMMKRIGYSPEFAAAVEACASTGGQIVPPVMGTAAFLMADYIGMPYRDIMVAAIIPCLLYYFAIFMAVHLRAKHQGLRGLSREECPDLKKALKERGHLIIPFILVIYLICAGYSAVFSGFWGIASTFIVAQCRKTTRMSARDVLEALIEGAKRSVSVAVACACVGFIIGIVTLTGIGITLGNYILVLAQGKLLLTCILAMLLSIILGMGLPCTGVYIVMATIVAPVLTQFGVPTVAAHLFCFYYGIMASITPPVAIAAYAGAGIAQCNPARAGWISFRIAIPSLLIPYVFVYNSSILLVTGMPLSETVTTLVAAVAGIIMLCMALERFAKYELTRWEAVLLGVSGFLLVIPEIITDIIGLVVGALIISRQIMIHKRIQKGGTCREI